MCSNPSGLLTANALVAVMTRSASRKPQQQLPQTTIVNQLPVTADPSPTIVLDNSVYHPQSNGQVERFNATFVSAIAKLTNQEINDWDEVLDAVIFAYNTGIHGTTGFSPYELVFGRKPQLPTDAARQELIFKKPIDYLEQLQKSLKIYHKQARLNMIKQQEAYKRRYDKNRPDRSFAVGKKVLLKIHTARSKLHPRYYPTLFTIVENRHPTYIVIDDETQQPHRVHSNDLREILEVENY
ncbi:unnamed protein product [Didymodactylos carnosus]|uniref:Integrase catalytic domain-containing protein n=1 Tax=Didymodactylos carnosus TaxID=1234261 RepID=A0A8S2H0R9_9BILA|nr:unnamed protein product [Didymodactylos carnosus]CAF3563353.1 unnamed protein product [Didymodactylos carnosus]